MRDAIDACAARLHADAPAFTRGNLYHAVRRSVGRHTDRREFDLALRQRLARSELPGLLPLKCKWQPRPLTREWDAYFPAAILLVDRPAILDLFVASGIVPKVRLAVVCIDGTPGSVLAWLKRGFRAGRRAPVVYLHDAHTVLYPFMIEPLATLVRYQGERPSVFRDLGIPPLGASPVRFEGTALPEDETLVDLEAVPPSALVRYAAQSALALVPGDPNMMPLTRERERREQMGARS